VSNEAAASNEAATKRRSSGPHLRGLTVVVFAVFAVVSAVLYVGAGKVSSDQEHRLLTGRAAEVGQLLSSSITTSIQSTLTSLASAAQQPAAAPFQQLAHSMIAASPTVVGVAVVRHSGPDWVVSQAAGKALVTGQALTGPRLSLIAATRTKLHMNVFAVSATDSRFGVALGPPASPVGTVVYEEFVVDPTQPRAITQSAPFHELNAALYVGAHPSADKLVLSTTARVPLAGRTASSVVATGDTSLLLVTSARQPLAGTLASAVPKILLGAVLLIGLAMAAVVESVGRRRDYAMGLVTERTAELQDSVNQLKEAQRALISSERLAALGQMAATVGHELRNPLGVLTNSMFLIRSAVAGQLDDRLRRQLDTADREISAATLIVSDLLEFSRPRVAAPTPVDVDELLEEALTVAPPPTGITVELDHTPVPAVVADRDQMRQVVLNLLTNAYEAMPAGGAVHLDARVVDDACEIIVADTGMGMDEQTCAQVFDPFFSMKIKGTGLGLAVSKRIVESHQGTLSLTSREGQGSTAIMRLPLTHAEVAAP
jgi:signal transduction histidine kinase